jgi:hypothetical protein
MLFPNKPDVYLSSTYILVHTTYLLVITEYLDIDLLLSKVVKLPRAVNLAGETDATWRRLFTGSSQLARGKFIKKKLPLSPTC